MTTRAAAALFALLCALPLPIAAQVANPGFEDAREAAPTMPGTWRVMGDGGTISLDTAYRYAGKQSVRIQKMAGATFTGVGQSIDALPWRGKVVRLSAWFKIEGLRSGPTTLWSRTDGGGKYALDSGSTRFQPPGGSADWTLRRAFLAVSATADRLYFGATLSGQGTLWVDGFEIAEVDANANDDPPSQAARDYIDDAIAKIRENAYRAGEVDWPAQRRLAEAIAAGAVTASDAHAAVSMLLAALKDGHSFLAPPSVADKLATDTRTDDFGVRSAIVHGKAYLDMPAFVGTHVARTDAFVGDLRSRIQSMAKAGACRWIVDLRRNTGGNMFPMLDGLVPLLGEGTLGYFVGRDAKTAWTVKDGHTLPGGDAEMRVRSPSAFLVDEGRAAVAVLTGPRTASSGEAVAVSFRGRPDTRSFGQPTAGQSSGNRGVRMSDGAMLLIMTSLFADRNGVVHGNEIAPDEPVAEGAKDSPLETDPVVMAAARWLDGLPKCKP